MIDNSLFIQIPVVLFCASLLLVLMEGFGYLSRRLISKVFGKLDTGKSIDDKSYIQNILIGGITYSLLFLGIGCLGLLSKNLVLVLSILPPLIAFIIGKRWRSFNRLILMENSPVLLGGGLFLILTFVLWFRPITNFDGTWYHLTVPKLFLQHNSVTDQGSMISYSLQPTITYFWNLWPLSLPVSTAISGIIVNTFYALFLSISLMYASLIGKKLFAWDKATQFITPILLGATYESLRLLGTGGNDLIGVAYATVATLTIVYIQSKNKITWYQFTIALLLIVGLASTKVFFLILASLLVAYLVIGSWNKLSVKSSVKHKLVIMLFVLFLVFTVTFLPWLIRSYLATGKILYPLGTSGFSEGVLRSEGGGTPVNHWTKFIFERFYSSILPILTFIYSPIILIGFFSIVSKKIRDKLSNLWLVSGLGLFVVFFASIALQWRYYLPSAILLIFIGLVVIYEFAKSLDIFGKLVLIGIGIVLVLGSCARVMWSSSDTTGLPSINGDLYISNFKGVDGYLNTKLSQGTYDYVQEVEPSDLGDNEKIYIGNAYLKPLPIYGMMKLAYVDNPIMERTINYKEFSNIESAKQFMGVLKDNKVRYILTHDTMTDVCKIMGIKDYLSCNDPDLVRHALHDDRWNVDWYILQ